MLQKHQKHTFISYTLVFIALFIGVLFTKDLFFELQENRDMRVTTLTDLSQARDQLAQLEIDKQDIHTQKELVQKYTTGFSEDELIDFMYGYAKKINQSVTHILIKDISFSEPQKNEIGFWEVQINLSVQVSSERIMKQFLDFLTIENETYAFFIDSFNYPADGRGG